MVRGVYVNRASSSRLSIEAALDRYRVEVTPTKRPTTQSREVRRIRVVQQALGKYSLMSLTPEAISNYRDKRLREGKSANTVRLELALLSNLYNIAMREWRLGIPSNPVAMVRKPAPGPGRDRRLCGDEEERLLAACDAMRNPMVGWIVRLAIFTGMRRGELLGIHCSQVNLDRRTITLTETKNGSARTVPLIKKAVRVLEAALANPFRPTDTDLLFFGEPGRDGKRRPFAVESAWYIALEKAGIEGLRFHDLRHEAVSRLVEAGLGDQEVAAISGHKSMQMLRRYTHLRSEDLVQRLDATSL
jgi:integrase